MKKKLQINVKVINQLSKLLNQLNKIILKSHALVIPCESNS
jgi:flagellar hook-associated protein FlgK